MFYSPSTGGFYDEAIHGDGIPADALQITAERHAELLNAQSTGKQIQAGEGGIPVAIDPPPPTRVQIEEQRLQAYANPTIGSDRYFSEVSRLQAMGGSEEEIEASRSAGVARYLEIQAEYPWP